MTKKSAPSWTSEMPNRRKKQYATTASVRNPPPKLSIANSLAKLNTCFLLADETVGGSCLVVAVSICLETNEYAMAEAGPRPEYAKTTAAYVVSIGTASQR